MHTNVCFPDAAMPLMTASKICKENNLVFLHLLVNMHIAHIQV
jgi:hypothetical protein